LLQPANRPIKVLPLPVVLLPPAYMPKNVLSLPVVLEQPAHNPAKKLLSPVVLAQPAPKPMNALKLPAPLVKPALQPIKVFWVPVLPVPDIQLTMLVLLHTLNTLAPPTMLPLTYKPVALTHNLAHAPAEIITVLHRPAEPTILPMMVFWQPVVTAQPALQPRNMLLEAVVLSRPAH